MKKLKLLIAKILGIDKMIYEDILEEISSNWCVRKIGSWTGNQPLEFDDWYENIWMRHSGYFYNKKATPKPVLTPDQANQYTKFVRAWHECGGPMAWDWQKSYSWYEKDKSEWTYGNDYSTLHNHQPKPKVYFKPPKKEANNG